MAILEYPWFFTVEHIAAGQSSAYLLGDGVFDSLQNISIVTVNSVRRIEVRRATFTIGTLIAGVPSADRVVWGMRYQAPVVSVFPEGVIFGLRSGGTLDFNLHSNGENVEVRRGSTVLETLPGVNDGTERYIEVAVRLDNVDGEYEVRYDGAVQGSASGIDTTVSGGLADEIYFSDTLNAGDSPRWRMAHLYLKEWDSPTDPGFLDPIVLIEDLPGSDVVAEFTPDSGVENFSRVNEAAIDDDTSYVESSVAGDVDEYGVPDLPISVEGVIAVVVGTVANAPSGGAPLIEHGISRGVDESFGAARGLSGNYRTQVTVFETAPDGSAWTPTKVNESDIIIRSG